MGLFDWLTPSPEKRIARARKAAERKDWALVRDELLELDGPEVQALRDQAFGELVTLNLQAAVSWANSGDEERVRAHLDVAAEHHRGGREQDFKDARRQIREIRAAHAEEEEERRRAIEARTMSVDPLHLGPANLAPAGLEGYDDSDGGEEARARLALVVENYPDSLRLAVADLGAPFARAVMDLEDGRPDLALQALLLLPDDQPLVRWERARTAYALGDPRAASRELRAFANLAGGHLPIGRMHSGLLLAQTLAEGGDPHEGLRVLRDLRATNPQLGGFLLAQLLATTEQLAEADQVLRGLIRLHPNEDSFYKLLAFVRIRGDQRVEAMRALEQGLHQNACASGSCGARPPDPEMKRLLATLYLEDGLETRRALQLLQESPVEGGPSWDDLYAQALAAKVSGDAATATRLRSTLLQHTPEGDPRGEKLTRYLAAPA